VQRLALFTPTARPVLYLGLVGFAPGDGERIETQLQYAPVGGVSWRICRFSQADAWVFNGAHTRLCAEDEVCIEPAVPGETAVRLRLSEVDRPLAFSRPLADAEFEPACTFELNATSSLIVLLAKFSHWLRPRAMLLAVADLLTLNAASVRRRSRVWHLVCDNRLIGVVDLQGEVGVLPDATLGELSRASWLPRPDSAGYLPDNFARKSLAGLLWDYAGRTQRDLLPARYRHLPVYLKRTPLLGARLFDDAHLYVLRELGKAPRTLSQLCAPGKFAQPAIVQALTAFYLVGSITSSPKRASESQGQAPASAWPWWMSQQPEAAQADARHTTGALPLHIAP
jgi:hypothetical protein